MAEKKEKKAKTEERKTSTPTQLEAAHVMKLEHAIDKIGDWMDKLGKLLISKRHLASQTQLNEANAAVEKVYADFDARLSAPTVSEKKGFKFSK